MVKQGMATSACPVARAPGWLGCAAPPPDSRGRYTLKKPKNIAQPQEGPQPGVIQRCWAPAFRSKIRARPVYEHVRKKQAPGPIGFTNRRGPAAAGARRPEKQASYGGRQRHPPATGRGEGQPPVPVIQASSGYGGKDHNQRGRPESQSAPVRLPPRRHRSSAEQDQKTVGRDSPAESYLRDFGPDFSALRNQPGTVRHPGPTW